MLLIDRKYKKALDYLRKDIIKRQQKEEELFLDWCKELDIHPDGEDGMILFSYLFNGEKTSLKFKK